MPSIVPCVPTSEEAHSIFFNQIVFKSASSKNVTIGSPEQMMNITNLQINRHKKKESCSQTLVLLDCPYTEVFLHYFAARLPEDPNEKFMKKKAMLIVSKLYTLAVEAVA